MIDIDLTKIALIGVVALVVIGPAKLPRVARMVGTFLGRAQRYINDVKSEVSREIELDELRKMQKDMQSAGQDVENSIAQNLSQAKDDFEAGWEDTHNKSFDGTNLRAGTSVLNQLAIKAKNFRKKKVARTSAIPVWYKQRHGGRVHVISGAARVAKYRPNGNKFPVL